MAGRHPVEILMDEHRVIESVLDVWEERLEAFATGAFDAAFVERALDFFRNFADGCHHAKEEAILFPALASNGIPQEGGPIGCMLGEHAFGRECLARVRTALPEAGQGSASAIAEIREAGQIYTSMLRQHIRKEDHILFQMAIRVLPPEAVQRMLADFANPADPRLAADVRAHYEEVAKALRPAVIA